MFIPCFTVSVLGKMEQKNFKNEGMSRLYNWLSVEGRFKPSEHYAMNYSVVDHFGMYSIRFS